ncbi:Adaptive-response sensory-kinase SasA [Paenibacillus solanacearum]|uniref:histidine kinase n=1 Tax=Paenibacillus solanacearum TaxID=2048548 RepID=A0A916K526_9BACL|nr:ATP-binding protein [Paenibacillus solanacearum]CAG7645048.1 Adaptive-response sensory-kinase SasA [Paenibacillus solanacearum]
MNISRSKLSYIYVVVIITLLAVVSISSFMASRNTERELTRVVNEVIPLSAVAEDLLFDLVNMETAIRGYEVAGDESFLEPYELGKSQLQQDLDTLVVYQQKYPRLRSVMESEATPQIMRLQEHYAGQLSLIRSGQRLEASKHITTGKNEMDRFRQIHKKVKAEIEEIASSAYNSARGAERTARTIIALGGVTAVVLALFSVVLFNRAYRAEAAVRRSEETYRTMAESLEAQNEEIIAQQEEQERTLEMLSQREQELETINSYQEKLTGATDLSVFLGSSVPALLHSLKLDAAMLVMRKDAEPDVPAYEIMYSTGYPSPLSEARQFELFGPAQRVFTEKQPIESMREATGAERGFHLGVAYAVDRYYPLFDDQGDTLGFLLLTGYLASTQEQTSRLSRGLIKQFGLAFLAQQTNEERKRQAAHLELLNAQLLQEKALIEEQHNLIGNILESTHEGMMMTDKEGKLLIANHRIELNHRIGDSIHDIFSDAFGTSPSLSALYSSIRKLLQGKTNRLNERFQTVNGDSSIPNHLELYATPVGDKRNQEIQGYLFVLRDRTEEEKIDEMKNEFISIVSHELRTPLASVLGFIEILLHRELTPEKRTKYMQTIYNEAMRLSTLINDFLDLQRMESGKQAYHFAPIELGELIREVAEQWQGKQEHRIELRLPEQDTLVRADADRLKQVVHNLLSNAIKYSPQADRVILSLRQEGDTVRFTVQDFGLGIPDDAKDKMFSKFYRVDNSDRRQIGGTGLGLSIVREIVEAHHGSITFESQMGEGTTFTVLLACHRMNSAAGSVLIVEDDDNLAGLIQEAIEKLKLPVLHVRSAEEGLLALDQGGDHGPKLCIVDILLEGSKSGWDFISELYRHPKFHGTPVIVSSVLEPPHHYRERNMEKYLRKPFSMEKLLEAAHQLLFETDQHPAYIFPPLDENFIRESLAEKGIEIKDIRRKSDHIEIEPVQMRGEAEEA